MSALSRRSLVASAAALPALASPTVTLTSEEHDPIFSPTRKFKEAWAAFNAYHGPDNSEEAEALEEAFYEAEEAWSPVVPTTLAGFKSKIDVFLNEYWGCRADEEQIADFLNTLYESARAIAEKAVRS
jgi:hypothetical protein